MLDPKDKLAALSKQLGLKTGAEWVKDRAENPPPPKPVRPGISEESASEDAAKSDDTAYTQQKDMLRTLGERLSVMGGADWATRRERDEEARAAGAYEIDAVAPGELVGDEESQFFLVRRDYPLSWLQGNIELGAALASASEHIAFSAADEALLDFDPRTALFMDTETTGLAGGSGTVAFLVGIGYFIKDGFRLDQCFMRDYDDEEAMLRFVAERFAEGRTVVSYNGKSFDMPLLRSRFIQQRAPFRSEGMPHYDLVHAARRFWKRRLSDCSLGNIEKEILGVRRHGDVPGHLIPEMWFEYLDTRDARPLQGVLYHHQMDILSLVALTGWLSQCLSAPQGDGFEHIEDRLSVVRVHFKQKKYLDVVEHANRFLEVQERGPMRRECLEMLALACKRLGRWLEMQQAWEQILEEFPNDIIARHELIKHHEHRTRDLPTAERLCREALDRLAAEQARSFSMRLERIQKKLQRGLRRPASDMDDDIEPDELL